jgi:hypothetical protein
MMRWDRARFMLPAMLASIATLAFAASAQEYPKQTQLPNPYRLEENWATLPKDMNGGTWGSERQHLGLSSLF